MSRILEDLLKLEAKYEKQDAILAEKIQALNLERKEIRACILELRKIAGIEKPSSREKFDQLVKPQFKGIKLYQAIELVLTEKDSQSRRQVSEAIALNDSGCIKKIMQSIRNLERYSVYKDRFDNTIVHASSLDKRPIKVISLKKPLVDTLPSPIKTKSQIDIFADLGDFSERAVAKHYPKKVVQS